MLIYVPSLSFLRSKTSGAVDRRSSDAGGGGGSGGDVENWREIRPDADVAGSTASTGGVSTRSSTASRGSSKNL